MKDFLVNEEFKLWLSSFTPTNFSNNIKMKISRKLLEGMQLYVGFSDFPGLDNEIQINSMPGCFNNLIHIKLNIIPLLQS